MFESLEKPSWDSAAEISGETRETQEEYEKRLFADFGWDPQEFLKRSCEHYYKESLELRSKELETERESFGDPDLYGFSDETYLVEGPNCYAFSMRWRVDPVTELPFHVRPMPGEIAHGASDDFFDRTFQMLQYGSAKEQKAYFSEMLKDDAKALGMELKEVDASYRPQRGEWIIAMAVSDNWLENPYAHCDYHFYRKGESGVWMHKPGMSRVENTDASGEVIRNPDECDRGMYTHFLGYYAVSDPEKGGTQI